ncbi:MAG: OadG family protein [Bacillota bacterium]
MDKIILGVQVVGMGMFVVMLALTLLALITSGMSAFMKKREATDLANIANKESAAAREKMSATDNTIIPEILAVITAAVASCMGRSTYRITTIKRLENKFSLDWNTVGRQEQVQSYSR